MKVPHTWSLATDPLFGKLILKWKNSIKVDLVEDLFSSRVGTVSRSAIWWACESVLKISGGRLLYLSIVAAMAILSKGRKGLFNVTFFCGCVRAWGFTKMDFGTMPRHSVICYAICSPP